MILLIRLTLGSRKNFLPESPFSRDDRLLHQKILKILFDVSPRPLCPSSLQFHTIDKSLWITTYTCHSYDHPPLILLIQDTPKFSLLFREYVVPTAQQFFATRIPLQINPRTCRVSTHPQLFMCFTMVFELLFDPPKFLSSLLLCNTCLLALWLRSICLAIFISIPCHRRFQPLI